LFDKKVCVTFKPVEYKDISELLNDIACVLNAGVKMIHLEYDNTSAGRFLEISKLVKQLCCEFDSLLILSDRIDVAYMSEADGILLRKEDMDISSARELLGEKSIVGYVVESAEDCQSAIKNGADYVAIEPELSTPKNPTMRTVGLEYAKWVSENIYTPAFVRWNAEELPTVLTGNTRLSVLFSKYISLSPDTVAKKLNNLTTSSTHTH
jgi:thiamine-phosphate diphosphorylase